MKIQAELLAVELKETFRISRGEASLKEACVLSCGAAWGECCPSIYYGYSPRDCRDEVVRAGLEIPEPVELSAQLSEFERRYSARKSLLAGLDILLHDYVARLLNLPLYQYLGIPEPAGKLTSYTVSIDTPENLERRLMPAREFSALKLKIGSEHDMENLRRICALGKWKVRVDANGAFTPEQLDLIVPELNAAKLELVEQPLKDADPADLRELSDRLEAPIYLDESVMEIEDLYRYYGAIGGVNVKLQRVGGIRPALKMIQAARSLGMQIMLGCMLETNIGNSAAAHLSGLADYLDLDSSFLLKSDPFEGITIDHGVIVVPDTPGIGVARKS